MSLGEFKSNSGNFIPTTKFDANANLGKPLIVIVREYRDDFTTVQYPDPSKMAFVMIADLSPVVSGGTANLYVNALLGGEAVAERLSPYAGQEDEEGNPVKLPVKLGTKYNEKTKRTYRTIEALSGAELELAKAWDTKFPTALQDERARLQAEVDAAAEADKTVSGTATAKATADTAAPKFDDDALLAAMASLKG